GDHIGKDIAGHGASAMADMHWSSRIGRDIFDIDLLSATGLRAAVIGARLQNGAKMAMPESGRKPKIDEAGARNGDVREHLHPAQLRGDALGEFARLLPGRLG